MKILGKGIVVDCAKKLNQAQHKLFTDYGLRQIKYMFEHDPVMLSTPPKGSVLIGLSQPFGRWTAIDHENRIRYGYFRGQNPEWSEADEFRSDMRYDKVDDLRFIYDTFDLSKYELDVLTHVHSNYLEWQK